VRTVRTGIVGAGLWAGCTARRELKRRDPGRTVALCRPCHRNVHIALSNDDLGRCFASLEALSVHPDDRRFTEWVRDKSHGRL